MSWYIDAMDGLGGLAFVSFRTADLRGGEIDFGAEAWVIEAPDFRPQPVASRAIGFAATGRGLQVGFSTDGDTEVAFQSLGSLGDFMRRTFLSGGGSDGAGGIVNPGGGPPDGGGGEGPLEGPPESLLVYASALLGFAERHQRLSATPQKDEGEATEEIRLGVATPAGGSGPGPFSQAFAMLFLQPDGTGRTRAASYRLMRYRVARFRRSGAPDDPLDILASLTVPGFVCLGTDGRCEKWRSVKDLFFGLLANPSLFLDAPYPKERIGLFLFAAAVQVHQGRLYDLVLNMRSASPEYIDFMRDVFEWLAPQMPRYAFRPDVEKAILNVAQ
ncbi:hypothetical protein ROLI_013620 [Roseobacter fucihabitans]|uniref:Uncharacterized protein n=1 Tax=Roseobacter fucihabitans TaxID=1537242 RepID=A0ABZ2BSV7_9RHOB|nr:hypothetical protein [Roseobacter litoralis]MBC6967015.1 hypothetical protein [Roseobacter litoralis]